jgi:hypothetical protein
MQLPDLLDLRALNYFTVHKKITFVVGCRSGVLLDDFISELHGARPKV